MKRLILAVVGVCMAMLGGALTGAQDDLYVLPAANARLSVGGTMDLTVNGRVLVASNMLNDTISLVDASARSLIAEIDVGRDPRGVSFTPDDSRVLVVNRADGTLSVVDVAERAVVATYPVGILPYAVVTTGGSIAYITLQASDEVIALDYTTGEIRERINTPPMPTGITQWGAEMLYVSHLWTGELSVIHLPQSRVVRVTNQDADMALSFSVGIDRRNGRAYLPQSRSYPQNPALTFDSAVVPMLNTFDLNTLNIRADSRTSLSVADRPVNMPFAVAIDTVRQWAFVVNAGTDNVSVIDMNAGLAVANLRVGVNPRAAILSIDNNLLYVHNALESSISIIDTRQLRVSDIVPISDLRVPIGRLFGAEFFHSARDPRMGALTLSCASCHFDGLSDGRVWRSLNDAPTTTPLLFGLEDTAPYTVRGAWPDIASVELKIGELQFGAGLLDGEMPPADGDPHGGLSLDLDMLAGYLLSLEGPPTPPVADAELVRRGAAVFAELECAACHSGDAYTDGQLHDVGTGGEFVTPSLRWLWLSSPYLHDGRAETLRDVFILPGDHQAITRVTPEEIDTLTAFLLSLPASADDE